MKGRPVRFLLLVGLSWIGLRVAMLWPEMESLPETLRQAVPMAQAKGMPPVLAWREPPERRGAIALRASPVSRPALPTRLPVDPDRVQLALFGTIRYGPANAFIPEARQTAPILPLAAQPPETLAALPDRWSASAWVVIRPGTGLGAAPGGSQIGGGQAGLVLNRMLVPAARVSAFARIAAPLRGKGAEAAIGVQWQPGKAPIRVVAEQRFGLDGARGGTGLGLVGGVDSAVPADFRLEAYGQAGAIRRARLEPYADGAVRATRTVATIGRAKLALGAGAWGAAQRDAARLDIGPSATLTLPANLRVSLDWRQRIAGDARPGSGLALTLGGDF